MNTAIALLSRFSVAVGICMLLPWPANAQEKLKVGIITTLSVAAGAVPVTAAERF